MIVYEQEENFQTLNAIEEGAARAREHFSRTVRLHLIALNRNVIRIESLELLAKTLESGASVPGQAVQPWHGSRWRDSKSL